MGLKIADDVTTKLIERNDTFSTEKGQTFMIHADNQPSVLIQAFKGERAMIGDNKSLGKFHLDRMQPASRGLPQVEVSFDIDASGILSVSGTTLFVPRYSVNRPNAPSLLPRRRSLRLTPFSTALISLVVESTV